MKNLASIPILSAVLGAILTCAASAADLRDDAREALRKAVLFYSQEVAKEGGYHYDYAADLSYGRSEHADGLTQVSVQRDGTTSVGMAFLDAWSATGDRLYLDAATNAAHALVKGQLCSGGWNYIIEYDPAKRSGYAYRSDNNCEGDFNLTVLDDNTSQAALRLMMRVDRELGFADKAINEAVRYALDALIDVQYPNGAWPQRFSAPPDPTKHPVKKASYPETWERKWQGAYYRDHYTLNDNTLSDVIDVFLEAARIYDEPKYRAAAERGGAFILRAQMPDPQPAWAQQYNTDMHPVWARQFEPPSVTGGESQGIMKTLMVLYQETGNRMYLEPIPRALAYLQRSILPPSDSEIYQDRSEDGEPVLARFYELKTNRPLYITNGTSIRVIGEPTKRPDGYEVTYSDENVISHYGVLTSGGGLAEIEAEYERLSNAGKSEIARPARLTGLSPWEAYEHDQPSESEVRSIIASMDKRGAWVEDGNIGKADRIVAVRAVGEMTVLVGDQTLHIGTGDSVAIFKGSLPVAEKVLQSETFVENVTELVHFIRQ